MAARALARLSLTPHQFIGLGSAVLGETSDAASIAVTLRGRLWRVNKRTGKYSQKQPDIAGFSLFL